jgi:hypothetical protein
MTFQRKRGERKSTMTDEHQALANAAAKALSLMRHLGWREATQAPDLEQDDMIEAVAAELAYRELHDALPVPAQFAAELIRDPLHDAKEATREQA